MPGIHQLWMPMLEPVHDSYPAIAGSVPLARRTLTAFAASAGATPEQLEAIRMATSEALTNAVVHAYGDGPGIIQVTAEVTAGELLIVIADDGRGMQARADSPGLGVGLMVIARVADGFAVTRRSTGGTVLEMRFSLGAGKFGNGDRPSGEVSSAAASA